MINENTPKESEIMQINELTDMPVGDDSKHYRMVSKIGYVDFGVFDNEMCAYMWQCPREGYKFLQELETHATKINKKLTISTILSPALKNILKTSGYVMKQVDYMGDKCEIWYKDDHVQAPLAKAAEPELMANKNKTTPI